MRYATLLSIVVLTGCVAPQSGTDTSPQAEATAFEEAGCRIRRVVDGDTISIFCPDTGSRNLRLTGYDTPETYQPKCRSERARGEAASRRLTALVRQARSVDVRFSGTDRYGRLLGRLFLDRADIARLMVAEGHAVPYNGGRRRNWCA